MTELFTHRLMSAFWVDLKSQPWKWLLAIVVSLWASIPAAMHLLLILMAFDYITGAIVAWRTKVFEAQAAQDGLIKKGLIIMLISVGNLVTDYMQIGIGLGKIMSIAYSVNELISIVENCAILKVPIPAVLVEFLVRVRRFRFQDYAEVKKQIDQVSDTTVVTIEEKTVAK